MERDLNIDLPQRKEDEKKKTTLACSASKLSSSSVPVPKPWRLQARFL